MQAAPHSFWWISFYSNERKKKKSWHAKLRFIFFTWKQFQNPIQMSLVTRKPVFGVCDQVRLKPTCWATGMSSSLAILDIVSVDIILSKHQTAKALISLRRCAGWSAPLLFAYGKNRFSHDVAQMTVNWVIAKLHSAVAWFILHVC